jgi:hypothetical protein
MEILDAAGIRLQRRRVTTTLEDLRRSFEQRLLPLMDYRRMDLETAR